MRANSQIWTGNAKLPLENFEILCFVLKTSAILHFLLHSIAQSYVVRDNATSGPQVFTACLSRVFLSKEQCLPLDRYLAAL